MRQCYKNLLESYMIQFNMYRRPFFFGRYFSIRRLFNRHFNIAHLTGKKKTDWELRPDQILHPNTIDQNLVIYYPTVSEIKRSIVINIFY
jgi:hypothetical protein